MRLNYLKKLSMENVKRLFIVLLIVITMPVSAQVIQFKTTAYTENRYNYTSKKWTGWGSWKSSNMLLTMDLQNDIIIIYSPKIQMYKIYEAMEGYYDSDGDYNWILKFIDQDNDRGAIRLLQRKSGASEFYVEFLNIKWCYRVRRI